MKAQLRWLNKALATKDLVTGMTHYRVQNREIRATDGRITGGHPWPDDNEFLVPGIEFEKLLFRMPGDPEITSEADSITIKSGRFRGKIKTLPLTEWNYPGVDETEWRPVPSTLLEILESLRPFISDNATQRWAMCVALENGWSYATNNVALAGAQCPALGPVQALLPVWAIDFILANKEDVAAWAWTDTYVAFKWVNGAWMRSQLVVGVFPEKAAAMIRDSVKEKPSQSITPEFREAFERIAELAEDTVFLYRDRIESKFGKAIVEEITDCEVPEGSEASVWGAKYLLPALHTATEWSPGMWPKPAVFKGPLISGYVVGRRM